MLSRKIDGYMKKFFLCDNKQALLITGARQIGKTYSIREFGKKHFKYFIEINFLNDKDALKAFSGAENEKDLMLRISAIAGQKLMPGETLIFLDEIQVIPDVLTSIKFLIEEGSYRYVLSGSLLGVQPKDIRSIPVGYLTIKEMHPLDLEEFSLACGIPEDIITTLRRCFTTRQPVDSFIHEKMMSIFRLYLVVGGMPAAVQAYTDTNNIQRIISIQNSIIAMYKADIAQYDSENKLYIDDIFDLIPAELNNQNKRFILKKLNENIRFRRCEDSFIWLRETGVALPVYNVEAPVVPLELAKLRNLFKLFSNDVGLLTSQYADGIQLKILNNEAEINFGAVYENAIAEELKAHGFKLYYFNSKKQGELDFVIKLNDRATPIEVKAGKSYSRHSALNNVLENAEYGIEEAFVLCNDNIAQKGKITYLPIYMAMFISDTEIGDMTYRIDLSSLKSR